MQSFEGDFYSWELLYVHFSFYSYVSSPGALLKVPRGNSRSQTPNYSPALSPCDFSAAEKHSCALIPPALQANLKDGTSHNEWIILKIHSMLNIT